MLSSLEERKSVQIGCTRQNCYVLGLRSVTQDIYHVPEDKKYCELHTHNLSNGYVEKLAENDYPITSDSVTSYMDTADYRNDPLQAIASAPKRVNLGDVSQVQEFIHKDPQSAVRVLRDVLKTLENVDLSAIVAKKDDTENKGGENL